MIIYGATALSGAVALSAVNLFGISKWSSSEPRVALLDAQLQIITNGAGLAPIDLGQKQDPVLVALGEALFIDNEISKSPCS